MKPKTLLRFFTLLLVITGSMLYLSIAGKASAERIRLREATVQRSMVGETSNTDFIFFGSISRLFLGAIQAKF